MTTDLSAIVSNELNPGDIYQIDYSRSNSFDFYHYTKDHDDSIEAGKIYNREDICILEFFTDKSAHNIRFMVLGRSEPTIGWIRLRNHCSLPPHFWKKLSP